MANNIKTYLQLYMLWVWKYCMPSLYSVAVKPGDKSLGAQTNLLHVFMYYNILIRMYHVHITPQVLYYIHKLINYCQYIQAIELIFSLWCHQFFIPGKKQKFDPPNFSNWFPFLSFYRLPWAEHHHSVWLTKNKQRFGEARICSFLTSHHREL